MYGKIITITVTFFLFSFYSTKAQRNCGTMDYLLQQQQMDSSIIQKMQAIEVQTSQYINNKGSQRSTGQVITIPVVVHVVYNTTAQNISDAQIQSQITALNKDFRKLNADTSSIPSAFKSLASDILIQFALAVRDPNGNTTSGIVRTSTSTTSFSTNNNVKYTANGGHDAWPAASYLNLWVCNLGSSLLGYAQFPGGAAATDGVVINYTAFGTTGTATSPFNLGRTATHEIGHWLNLRHIWGDATCGDDLVYDTPTQQTMNYNCPTFPHVTCSNGANGDMFVNYMDYTNDNCMYMFTAGQSARMNALFDAGATRESLLNSMGLTPVVTCNTPASVSTSNNTGTAATISWGSVSGSTAYVLQYKLNTDVNFTNINTTSTNYTLTNLTQAQTYAVQVYAVCPSGNSNASTLVNFTNAGIQSVSSNASLCLNDSITLIVTPAGAYSYSYQWKKNGTIINGATSSFYLVKMNSAADSGNYSVVVSQAGYSYASNPINVSLKSKPQISSQPVSQNVCPGSSFSLSVATNAGANTVYQWYKNGSQITGATSAVYNVTSASTSDTASYYVNVFNACGTNSNAALIQLKTNTNFNTQPVSQSRPLNSSCLFTCSGVGSGNISYQWRKNNIPISGATNASLQINNLSYSDTGTYSVTLSADCRSINSSDAYLSIITPTPGYEARIENEQLISNTEYQFDIVLYATSPLSSWELSGFTVGIGINPLWRNGATINSSSAALLMSGTSEMKSSPNQIPSSATFSASTPNRIQIASTSTPGAGNGTIITTGGKRLIRVRLQATSGSFSSQYTPDLYFLFSSYPSSLSAYINGVNTVVAGSSTNTVNGYKASDGASNLKTAHYTSGNGWNQTFWSGSSNYLSIANSPQNNEEAVVLNTSNLNLSNLICRGLSIGNAVQLNVNSTNTIQANGPIRLDGQLGGNLILSGANQNISGNGNMQLNRLFAGGGGNKNISLSSASIITDSVSISGNTNLINTNSSLTLPCNAHLYIENGSAQTGLTLNNITTQITQQAGSLDACVNDSIAFAIQALGNNLSYQWQKNNTSIAGANQSFYSINNFKLSDSGNYRVIVSGLCGSVNSQNYKLAQKSSCNSAFAFTLVAFIEGFWTTNSMTAVLNNIDGMSSTTLTDSIQIDFVDSSSQNISYTLNSIIQSNGQMNIQVPSALLNKSYYLVLKHRNAVETWSASPIVLTSNGVFDFSSNAQAVFGNNVKAVNANQYLIYSGDIDHDGIINNSDIVILDNDNTNMLSGYIDSDLNGDGVVTNDDAVILDNNNANFIGTIKPF